jgi:hypothetical protein
MLLLRGSLLLRSSLLVCSYCLGRLLSSYLREIKCLKSVIGKRQNSLDILGCDSSGSIILHWMEANMVLIVKKLLVNYHANLLGLIVHN